MIITFKKENSKSGDEKEKSYIRLVSTSVTIDATKPFMNRLYDCRPYFAINKLVRYYVLVDDNAAV